MFVLRVGGDGCSQFVVTERRETNQQLFDFLLRTQTNKYSGVTGTDDDQAFLTTLIVPHRLSGRPDDDLSCISRTSLGF